MFTNTGSLESGWPLDWVWGRVGVAPPKAEMIPKYLVQPQVGEVSGGQGGGCEKGISGHARPNR